VIYLLSPDFINGLFEAFAGLFVLNHGGLFVVAANAFYVGMMVHYRSIISGART
jgi:hypothetical protein